MRSKTLLGPITAILASSLSIGLLSGCSVHDEPAKITRTGTAPAAEAPDGTLERTPSPLTARDVSAQPADSAQQAVTLLWFYGQWGNTAGIYALYDARVQRALGADTIVGAYNQERPTMLASRLHIVDVKETDDGTLVNVELLTRTAAPRPESFLLGHRTGEWLVRYDSYLKGAAQTYVQARKQTQIDPVASKPAPEAVKAGARVARRYRNLFVGK